MRLEVGEPYRDGFIVTIDKMSGKGLLCEKNDRGTFSWKKANIACERWNEPWRLPTKRELNLLYQNLACKRLGNFLPEWYWSQSKQNNHFVWAQRFSDGLQIFILKKKRFRVRAVMEFDSRERI